MDSTSQQTLIFAKHLDEPGEKLLTKDAQDFLLKLHRQFNKRRLDLLEMRQERQKKINAGASLDFLSETNGIREDLSWKVGPTPADLQKRLVEITGPTDPKMMINALNSGADVFMADFEDANSPTWHNVIDGQNNLKEAVARTLSFQSPEGKSYKLNETIATLVVRPRGWHLSEKHVAVNEESISASLFDFGMAFFTNAKTLIKNGSGPYFYLPKMESHLEARLWNDVFIFAQEELGIPRGTIRATVLIETIFAAFEMEEILYELKEHMSGLNAGRWDYIFSIIKTFNAKKSFLFPDRSEITMTAPFMRAYTELLVKTCHKRSAHAMGGMAAFIPSRKDQAVNEVALAKVKEDKARESKDGFDGTWVAHPDLVPIARTVFEKALQGKAHQKEIKREDVAVSANDLLNFEVQGGHITEDGFRQNINISLRYLSAWLQGTGAVAIFNLMEDVATAEISRAQLWQWLHHEAILADSKPVTKNLYLILVAEEKNKIHLQFKNSPESQIALEVAESLLNELVLSADFPTFLTHTAYPLLK